MFQFDTINAIKKSKQEVLFWMVLTIKVVQSFKRSIPCTTVQKQNYSVN